MTPLACPPAKGPEAVAGYADSGLAAARRVTFFGGAGHAPGPWTAVSYAEVPPGAAEAHGGGGREQVLLVVSGSGLWEAGGTRQQARAGDAFTCPAGTGYAIRVPGAAGRPVAVLAVEAFPGSPQRASCPQRIPLLPKMAGCAGYRGGGYGQETLVAVTWPDRYLTGAWRRLSLIEVEPGGILGDPEGQAGAVGYRRPFNSAEILFTVSGTAEITAGGAAAGNQGRPGRKLCVGVPPGASVLVRNLSPEQPLLLASTEMGVPR